MNFSNMETIRKANSAEIKRLCKRVKTLKGQIQRKNKKIDIMKTILGEFEIETLIND